MESATDLEPPSTSVSDILPKPETQIKLSLKFNV